MADALHRVSGEEAVEDLIYRVLGSLAEHLSKDDESLEAVRHLAGALREIQEATEAVVRAAAVALRAAKKAAQEENKKALEDLGACAPENSVRSDPQHVGDQ